MKLILASSGFNAPEAVQKCIEFVGKPAEDISVAVIFEALKVEKPNHDWFLDDINRIRDNFGGGIQFVDLQALDIAEVEKRLNMADVIFASGGDSGYLGMIYEKTGFAKLLPKLLETKVYVGSSAGSVAICREPSQKWPSTYGRA